jgi:serine/threonine-protein kinase
VIERLGEGGMGEVFLVEDLKLQRREALKLIAEHLTRDETRRQRFLQEPRLAASIDHPHIASIHDIGEVRAGPTSRWSTSRAGRCGTSSEQAR